VTADSCRFAVGRGPWSLRSEIGAGLLPIAPTRPCPSRALPTSPAQLFPIYGEVPPKAGMGLPRNGEALEGVKTGQQLVIQLMPVPSERVRLET
jgi:hypothetical protein